MTKKPIEIEPELILRVRESLSDIREGKMVILVDDEDRENEGDLVFAAEHVTPQHINFMAKHARGLICVTLTEEQVERLELPMMRLPKRRSGPSLGTAFTLSIEARHGVTTGISAADRARTVAVAIHPDARPEDIVTPGHVFPLKARKGGVLVRTGQTEGSVDLARMAGCIPAGVICEIMNDDGTMARMPDLEKFAALHGLRVLTIADLIRYRLQTEQLVSRLSERVITLDQTGTEWRAVVYNSGVDARQLLALIKGDPSEERSVLCRVHRGATIADMFTSSKTEGGRTLQRAVQHIEAAGVGVVVYLPPVGDLKGELESLRPASDPSSPFHAPPPEGAGQSETEQRGILREFGLGAQVLSELGLRKIRLLTNNPRKIAGLRGYGLEIIDSVPLAVTAPAG